MIDILTIFVTGATGAQGGATVDALLRLNYRVRALARNPNSMQAQALAGRGVDIVAGDFADSASLARGVDGADGVFSVQMPSTPDDRESEVRAGTLLIATALKAGITRFVHTSVARAGDHEQFAGWAEGRWGHSYWTGKAAVNDLVARSGFRNWTILKPAFFMDNFIPPKAAFMFPSLDRGVLETVLLPTTRQALIAAEDIGHFAAAAFSEPETFHGRSLDLAGDALTMVEVAAILAEVSGEDVRSRTVTPGEAITNGVSDGVVRSQEWANEEGYQVNLATARSLGIGMLSFAEWARRRRAAFRIAPPVHK